MMAEFEEIVVTEIKTDEWGRLDKINIELTINSKDLIDNGISGLYDPVFDEIKKLENQLDRLGYLTNKKDSDE
jgi:hypothetical protein